MLNLQSAYHLEMCLCVSAEGGVYIQVARATGRVWAQLTVTVTFFSLTKCRQYCKLKQHYWINIVA